MEKLKEKLHKWQEEANEYCGLRERSAYQRVIDEIDKRITNESVEERIKNADENEPNWSYYFDELFDILAAKVAVKKDSGEPEECGGFECEECLFKDGCVTLAREWLLSLYRPIEKQPVLTIRERTLLELVEPAERGWIARDKDGSLRLYDAFSEFQKTGEEWICSGGAPLVGLDKEMFPFIKWEDEEPWSFEDLLKLEVEEC